MTSSHEQRNTLSIRGVDPELWKWLKSRAGLEGKSIGKIINELVLRYKEDTESSGIRQQLTARNAIRRSSLTIRGINHELVEWLKSYAQREGVAAGEIINSLIERYMKEIRHLPAELRSPVAAYDMQYIINVRGIDRDLWQYIKEGADLEDRYVGELLNELIDRYKREVESQGG